MAISQKAEKTKRIQAPPPIEGAVTDREAARFAAVVGDVMRTPLARTQGKGGIGTLREQRLHMALKAYLCPDISCHERPVADLLRTQDDVPPCRRMVADVLTDGHIYEIQTGGFFPLRDKLAWYLTHTPYKVTVVHPIPAVKYLSWIDPEGGQVVSRRRSPRRGRVRDVAGELYWLTDFIADPRFSLHLMLLEIEEYRMMDGWSRDKKRGSNRYERFPTALLGQVSLQSPEDYAEWFLPDSLGDGLFTAADYTKATGIRGRAAYGMLHLLESCGALRAAEKVGRAQGYQKTED